jgi:MFS family permease
MVVLLGGTSGGQLMLSISSPLGYELFVLSSLLISIAVIPILLSTARAPQFDQLDNISILQLYRVSQLGVFGMFVNGMCYGTIYGMGAVYATKVGMSVREVSLFMGTMVLGGFLFQYPLGILSDAIGRKKIIVGCCIAGAITSLHAAGFSGSGFYPFVLVTVVGGFTMPVYALCGVHTNDYLTPPQMVAASGTLVLLSAAGAAIGAPLTAFFMDHFGPKSFYLCLSLMMTTIALFALYRVTQRTEKEERGDFMPMPSTPLTAALNPDVGLEELEAAVEMDIDEIQSSIEELIDDENG